MRHIVLGFALSSFFFFACAQDKSDPQVGSGSAAAHVAGRAESAIVAGGRWSFSLDDSPGPAKSIRAQCSRDANPEACYANVREHAKLESIGFDRDANGQLYWVSLDDDGSLLRKLPIRIVESGNDYVVVAPAGEETGKQMPRIPAGVRLKFEVAADGTLTQADAEKGNLVFKPIK